MATYTKSSKGFQEWATWTCTITSNTTNINVTGSTFSISALLPTVTGKITWSGLQYGSFLAYIYPLINGNLIWVNNGWYAAEYSLGQQSWANNASKSLPLRTSSITLTTSNYFNSTNKTVRKLSVAYNNGISSYSGNAETANNTDFLQGDTLSFNFSQTITLDVPPTFSETFSYTGDFSGVPYANLTTASVTLSNLTALYGGDFSGVGNAEFIIGSQSVSKPNPVNGDVLSIALNAVGTFTPTIKITDSRGQVATHTLSAITVMGYNAPTVSFDASRTLSDGTPDDEGTYAFLEATFTFTDVIADAVAPSVVVTDDDGTVTTPVVDWYTDAGLTTPVTWSSLSSGDTVYGIFSGLSTQHSYTVSIRPRDSEGTGTAVTQTIGAAFYTVDFLAGGHGIAFGKPASNVGFECAMEATFEDDAFISLPDYQTASTTDKAIYDAVVALGWDSDVLIS